jgi:MFS family permease
MSMNFNTSVYANGVLQISEEYGVSEQAARVGQAVYLITYAFACELWAPYSEEFGRWPILQLSCFLINIWQILAALAPNYGSLIVARALGGASTAGGSVTLGMVADLYKPDEQQYAVAYVVWSSVGGAVIGPIFGGMLAQWAPLQWNFWTQLLFGAATQVVHFFLVPETRTSIMLDKEAKHRRKSGEDDSVYGPNELKEKRLDVNELLWISVRPFEMFLREPIVLCLSLLSGFSDALIFTFLEGFNPVFSQWDFSTYQVGLAFCS